MSFLRAGTCVDWLGGIRGCIDTGSSGWSCLASMLRIDHQMWAVRTCDKPLIVHAPGGDGRGPEGVG